MALSFHHTTTASVFGHSLPAPDAADMTSFLHDDVHSEVSDALLGFVYDPLDPSSNTGIDELLDIPISSAAASLGAIKNDTKVVVEQHCDKKLRAACTDDDVRYGLDSGDPSQEWYGGGCGGNQQAPALTEFLPPLPPLPQPLAFVHGSDEAKKPGGKQGCHQQSVQSAAARERRKRISRKTAELSRLIPGGNRMSTADMLEEAGRHVKLLQAQVGMLALMHSVGSSEKEKVPITAALEEMHPLLASGSVQERLAAEGKCLVPRKLVDAVANDSAVKSNPRVNRDLGRFIASLDQQ